MKMDWYAFELTTSTIFVSIFVVNMGMNYCEIYVVIILKLQFFYLSLSILICRITLKDLNGLGYNLKDLGYSHYVILQLSWYSNELITLKASTLKLFSYFNSTMIVRYF